MISTSAASGRCTSTTCVNSNTSSSSPTRQSRGTASSLPMLVGHAAPARRFRMPEGLHSFSSALAACSGNK